MLVYGDHRVTVDPRKRLDEISSELRACAAMTDGIERHARLVGILIEAGKLQQAIEDEGLRADDLNLFVHRLAKCVMTSWDSAYKEIGDPPGFPQMPLPPSAEISVPEGFAFYALYPEAYIKAARELKLVGPPRVIGIRSIGTTLGAIVAVSVNAPLAVTVRPTGNSFARTVELPSDILDARSHYIIVDEGPGLSGSSFGSVADWLQERGVPLRRIAFLPSHSGDPGSQASNAHRDRWRRAQRIAAKFDNAFIEREFGPLEAFAIGSPWERPKFIAHVNDERVLLKFAGLGQIGERKLELARTLHAIGFTPEPLGLVHGFIVERWYENARSLGRNEKPLDEIGRYIGARARLLSSPDTSGASIEKLLAMCRRNVSLAFGDDEVRSLGAFDAADLQERVTRVRSDNRLDKDKWLRLPSGRLLKTDALDHHQAHDLIGCQAAEWDIAGAIEEFELDVSQATRLIEMSGLGMDSELLHFYRVAYAAFRLGQSELGGLAERANNYAQSLRLLLHQNSCPSESAQILV